MIVWFANVCNLATLQRNKFSQKDIYFLEFYVTSDSDTL